MGGVRIRRCRGSFAPETVVDCHAFTFAMIVAGEGCCVAVLFIAVLNRLPPSPSCHRTLDGLARAALVRQIAPSPCVKCPVSPVPFDGIQFLA